MKGIIISEDRQIGFRVNGLISPVEGNVYHDYILVKGIPPLADSYVFLKFRFDENEDQDQVKDKIQNSLKKFTHLYSLISNHHTEITSSNVTAKVSVTDPFGIIKYPPDGFKFIAIPTDEQRAEHSNLLDKTFEKYQFIEETISPNKKKQFLINAIDYYNRALGDIRKEDKLIDLMICLESLFSYEKDELRLRYSIRLSQFIGAITESETSNTFKMTYDLYDKRSKIVHGTESVTLNDADVYTLQKHLREVIRVFLYIDLNKNTFLKLLDESLYNDDRKIELKKVIDEASEKW